MAKDGPHSGKFKPGDCFYSYFCDLMSLHKDYLNIIKSDLNKEKWHGARIELARIFHEG